MHTEVRATAAPKAPKGTKVCTKTKQADHHAHLLLLAHTGENRTRRKTKDADGVGR